MGNRKGLKYLIAKFSIYELIYTFFIIIFAYLLLNSLIYNKILYPANYSEKNSIQIEKGNSILWPRARKKSQTSWIQIIAMVYQQINWSWAM